MFQSSLATSLLSQKKKKELPPPPSGAAPIEPSTFVKLISMEGHVFIVDKQCAKVSKLIKSYLSGQTNVSTKDVTWDEANKDVVRFPFIAGKHLEATIQYFYFKVRFEKDPDNRPEFHVAPEMALDLIKVATLLQC
jgi:transcription elongation factor B subunit 1